MENHQDHSMFPLNHGQVQDGFEGYPQYSQQFFFPTTMSDNVHLGLQSPGDFSTQPIGWNPPAPLEPPSHLNFYPPQYPVRDQIRYNLGRVYIKEEEDYRPVGAFPGVQYYHPYWNNRIWPGAANPYPNANKLQEASNVPPCTTLQYPLDQSPNIPEPPMAPNIVSPQCCIATPSPEAAEDQAANATEGQNLMPSDGEVPQVFSRVDMEKFVKEVKERRVAIGFTQADVGCTLGVLCGKLFSQTTICRFESLQLSPNNMCQLQPLMKRWMKEKVAKLEKMICKEQALTHSKRKRRTNIENVAKGSLESYFRRNPKPGTPEMNQIARELQMDKSVVRVWFCNRRQRDKKNTRVRNQSGESADMQPMINPFVGPFPSPQEMSPQNYMAAPPQFYPHGFNQRNDTFPPHMPHGNHM